MRKLLLPLLWAVVPLSANTAESGAKVSERIAAILSEANEKQYKAMTKIRRDYRASVAKTFAFADRVEVFLLDHAMGKDPAYQPKEGDETFPIRPYNKETKILKKLTIPAPQIPKWAAAVTKMLTTEKWGGGAMCHFPIHGMRIYFRDQLLFETSICWKCDNYYFENGWEGLTEDAADLKALLDGFMPIPEEEKARFPGPR
jgi:hypothetical protein